MGDALAFDDALMGDFLRDIIYPDHNSSHNAPSQMGFLPDVLDFGFDTLLDMPPPMFDQELPSTTYTDAELNPLPPSRSGAVTPNVRKVIDIGQQAFKDSFWLWTPASGDNRSAEQTFLTISEDQIVREENDIQIPASFTVSLASRDRLLSMILGTCDPATQRHVLARFPSGKLISSILNWFLARRFDETGWWLHVPSMHVNQEHETFLAGLLSAAAVESHHPDIRKLGFAVQEAARIGVANRFEEDNRSTRDLRILQAFALQLHAGFWSGMRRKMEIAESFAYPLITMLRRSGRFRLSRTNQGDTNAQDEWRNWIREESFKRLAYHVLILDATMSMSMLTQPLLSPAEFQLELPCSPKLWTAASADEWQSLGSTSHDILLPTIRDTMANLGVLVDHQCNVDVQLSLEIVIAGLWSRVWQFRQLRATSSLDGSHSNSLPANSLHQELQHNFQYLKMRSVEWEGSISAPVALKLQLCQMHLYVSLEDIQVFGGKEGATEARRTVPQLQAWAQSREAREALYHAGQALEAATQLETGTLRGFAAVAVYHASLVLWAYGILLDPSTRSREYGPPMILGLDNDDVVHLQRFLVLGQGSPCIRDYCDFASNAAPTIPVTDPARVMNSIAALLSNGSGSDERSALPIVTNLSKLMRSLGNAAIVMKRIHS
ncbi:uncharacterized protein HMPREF1541_01468 [Cyphellophora europaea CBS 101466]|uniref:Xylanolytic transcriptional activator regulatory domain-containing protein n=1 Tax=Cyphellophora europaea (strain CBS 101466) TaxID=1220924 RepID=W2S2X5_CYPE1|nr:uncharacterized protein HMPREF1541_01468 [Cyphellophora europaea CBS 101466]ETN42314.1 hypothetical protein HMPREF1541_01468 [Cyphellophora europaea CBS 101466]